MERPETLTIYFRGAKVTAERSPTGSTPTWNCDSPTDSSFVSDLRREHEVATLESQRGSVSVRQNRSSALR
jgi:hypothetical protein